MQLVYFVQQLTGLQQARAAAGHGWILLSGPAPAHDSAYALRAHSRWANHPGTCLCLKCCSGCGLGKLWSPSHDGGSALPRHGRQQDTNRGSAQVSSTLAVHCRSSWQAFPAVAPPCPPNSCLLLQTIAGISGWLPIPCPGRRSSTPASHLRFRMPSARCCWQRSAVAVAQRWHKLPAAPGSGGGSRTGGAAPRPAAAHCGARGIPNFGMGRHSEIQALVMPSLALHCRQLQQRSTE